MKLAYFSYSNVSVFDSQVIELLNYYARTDKFQEIILICGINSHSNISDIERKVNVHKIRIFYFKIYHNYPFIDYLTIISLKNVIKNINGLQNFILHVRNEVLALYVKKAIKPFKINPKLLIDIRGAGYEQLKEYGGISKLKLFIKKFHRDKVYENVKLIGNISVVSESLKAYVINRINFNQILIETVSCLASDQFCFNNQERESLRYKLGIKQGEILLIFLSGGSNDWQNCYQTISIFINKGYKILNMSKAPIRKPGVINMFVPYLEVSSFLSAADVGIIWREKSITNKVASPVKFSEFVCCGLPVITNNSIDMVADFIYKENAGAVLNSIESIDDDLLHEMLKIDRDKLSYTGRKYFGIDNITKKYFSLYSKLI